MALDYEEDDVENRFDDFAKSLAAGMPRREALGRLLALLAGALLPVFGLGGKARAGSPAVCERLCHQCKDADSRKHCLDVCKQCGPRGMCGTSCATLTCCPDKSVCCEGKCCGPTPDFGCCSNPLNGEAHCVNFDSDPLNCGRCGVVCPEGHVCCNGRCCPPGAACCKTSDGVGICTDVVHDPHNCGKCGTACPPGVHCCAGKCCGPFPLVCCPSPAATDITICANVSNDPHNCGQCGIRCPEGSVCCNGKCCPAGSACCATSAGAAVCVNVKEDVNNCGKCGIACPPNVPCCGGVCCGSTAAGSTKACCTVPGATVRICVDTATDPRNCGACGKVCPTGSICVQGKCGPPPNPAG